MALGVIFTMFNWRYGAGWQCLAAGGVIIAGLFAAYARMYYAKNPKSDSPSIHFEKAMERKGLSLTLECVVRENCCYVDIHYLNRCEGLCAGRVMLCFSAGFLEFKSALKPQIIVLRADGGEYGVARIPVGIPMSIQGKRGRIYVTADAKYPNGKCKVLYESAPISIHGVPEGFGSLAGIFARLAGYPCSVQFPKDVMEKLPQGMGIEVEVFEAKSAMLHGFPVILMDKGEKEKPTE